MEDMNDPLERERLKLQELAQTEESIFGRRWDPETQQRTRLLFRAGSLNPLKKEEVGNG